MKRRQIAILFGCVFSVLAYADTKISALPDGGTIQVTDQVPVNRSGATNRVVIGALGAKSQANLTSDVTSLLPVSSGGSGLGTLATHSVLLGEGTASVGSVPAMGLDTLLQGSGVTNDPVATSVPNCGSATQALGYSTSTHTFGCQTVTPLATPVTVANGGTGLATLPTHTVLLGQGTSALGNVAAMAADTLLQGQGATVDPAATTVPNCGSATTALSYSTASHTFGCQTITTSGAASAVAKNADTSRASTTSLTDDPTLLFTSQSAGTYSVEWVVAATGPGTAANLKIALNCTGTVTLAFWSMNAMDANGNASAFANQSSCSGGSSSLTVTVATSGAQNGLAHGFGYVVTSSSGTISLQWAQGTSNAGATVLKQGSWMRIQKIL